MSQGLPIQGAQVQEIQGGMRLTPLGLRQLGSLANQVSLPTGAPLAMADPGSGNTTTLYGSTHAPIEPTRIYFSIPNQNYTGTGTYSLALYNYGFTITGASYLPLVAGFGSANEVLVKNGATTVLTIDTISAVADVGLPQAKIEMTDITAVVIPKNGTLVVAAKGGGVNKTAGLLVVEGFVSS